MYEDLSKSTALEKEKSEKKDGEGREGGGEREGGYILIMGRKALLSSSLPNFSYRFNAITMKISVSILWI